MTFPLRLDFLAMDDPRKGVHQQIIQFSGLLELSTRKDASKELIKYYQTFSSLNDENIFDLVYLEILLADTTFINAMTTDELHILKQQMLALSQEKLKDSTCSSFKILPSYWLDLEIAKKLEIAPCIIKTRATNLGYITIYTPKGSPVTGEILQEFSTNEISRLNTNISQQYPEATFIASASQCYNCHSYAWNMIEGGKRCWINNIGNNLSQYWKDGSYIETTENEAEKIYYYNGDHSAILSSVAGKYDSKWGAGPVMRHAPGYGPYTQMSNRKYYKKAFGIEGPNWLYPGSYYQYALTGGQSATWSITNNNVGFTVDNKGLVTFGNLKNTGSFTLQAICNDGTIYTKEITVKGFFLIDGYFSINGQTESFSQRFLSYPINPIGIHANTDFTIGIKCASGSFNMTKTGNLYVSQASGEMRLANNHGYGDVIINAHSPNGNADLIINVSFK